MNKDISEGQYADWLKADQGRGRCKENGVRGLKEEKIGDQAEDLRTAEVLEHRIRLGVKESVVVQHNSLDLGELEQEEKELGCAEGNIETIGLDRHD